MSGVQTKREQDAAPAKLTEPARHAVHAEAIVWLLYVPAAQAVHTREVIAAATLLYAPTLHVP